MSTLSSASKRNSTARSASAPGSSKRPGDDVPIQRGPVKRRRLARGTRDENLIDIFPHGINPEDSPRTAAARAERARRRRDNRSARRGGEDVESTPPLPTFVARQTVVEEPPVHRPQVEDDNPVHPNGQSNSSVASSARASPASPLLPRGRGQPRRVQPQRRGRQRGPEVVRRQGGSVTLREDPPYDLQDPNRFSAPALSPEDEARRQKFLKALDEVQMTTCSRCKER